MTSGRRGAVRSDASREAILKATASLVDELGYERVTIEGIASSAGVGKQTIYRWWSSKGAVVSESLAEGHLVPPIVTPPTSGDIRVDLTEWLSAISDFLAMDNSRAVVKSLIAASAGSEHVVTALAAQLGGGGGRDSLSYRLREAETAGQLPAAASASLLTETLLGAVVMHVLTDQPFDKKIGQSLVAMTMGTANLI